MSCVQRTSGRCSLHGPYVPFGKPEWFVEKTFGWGLTPVTWQGWLYTLIWVGAMILPFAMLMERQHVWEAFVWLFAIAALLVHDVWHIVQAKRAAARKTAAPPVAKPVNKDVLYIGNDNDKD